MIDVDWMNDDLCSWPHVMKVQRFFLAKLVLLIVLSGCGEPGSNSSAAACHPDAVGDLQNKAEFGIADAQNELGRMYEYGECFSRDFEEAARWYLLAAEQGHVNAQKVLGFMYAVGMGVPQDDDEAVKWFRKASVQGHPEAQVGLGIAYFRGLGVARDLREAHKWFRQSAEQGFARGQYNLGHLYEIGAGVLKDHVQAYKWYLLASGEGYTKAGGSLKKLAENMTPSEIEEASRLAKEWQPVSTPGI